MREEPSFLPAVVAPTFNNARTLRDVVTRVTQLGLPVFVVDDGSTDETAAVLDDLRRGTAVRVVTHPRNRGKAAALNSGFAAAAEAGYTHAVSIDTDGQLDPDEIPRLLDSARRSPRALVLGTRDDSAPDYPQRSRLGRMASNLFVWMESGLRVGDSQCGFRVYPLDLVRFVRCSAGRYGFETEILTRAGWAGAGVEELPVSCTYQSPAERVSHFQPWRDSFRAVGMHLRLLARAVAPWPHARWGDDAASRPRATLWRRLVEWINPARAWRDLRDQRVGAQELAAGVAVGVFIGNLPVFGVQTLLSLYAARRLHLHPLPVVAGSHISTPPLGPLLVAAAVGVGHWLLHGSWLRMPEWQATWQGWARLFGNLMLEWSLGSVLVGFVLAVAAYVVAHSVLSRVAAR